MPNNSRPRELDEHSPQEEAPREAQRPAPAREPSGNCPDTGWSALLSRIRSGDLTATNDFHDRYTPGARAIFRHHLGPIGTDTVVAQALNGAVEEIRQGWIHTQRDLVHFLRDVRRRQTVGVEFGTAMKMGLSDRVRVKLKAETLAAALDSALFSVADKVLLKRYYLDRQPAEKIAQEAGIRVEEFLQMKERLHRTVERIEALPKAGIRPLVKKVTAGV